MKSIIITLTFVLFFCSAISIRGQENMSADKIPAEQKESESETPDNKLLMLPVTVGAYFQMWFVKEQVENGKQQDFTSDRAVQEASGFSINKARIFLESETSLTKAKIELRLEGGSVGLLDAYAFFKAYKEMAQIGFGQMKIPSTYEVETSDSSLDFTIRSYFSSVVANWSLSKSTSSVSPFYGVQTYNRDAGAALKGDVYGFKYFFMVGNGLGANLFVGGDENRQFVYANKYGAYFYAGRISFDFMNPLGKKLFGNTPLSSLIIGGHYNRNKHPDILYTDKKTVLDIKRESWSYDVNIIIFNRIRLTGMYGKGEINDDFDNNNKPDYQYSGYEYKAVVEIIRGMLEAGFRYDTYTEKNAIYGGEETFINYTAGITYKPESHFRFQLNYKWKLLDSELNKDLKDNIMTIAGQYRF